MTLDETIATNLRLDPVEPSPEHARGDHLVVVERSGPDSRCSECGERLLLDPNGCPTCGRDIDRLGGNPNCDTCAAEPRLSRELPATIHDPRKCPSCANDPEQCHHDLDCEARAWANGYCGPHQPDKRSYH